MLPTAFPDLQNDRILRAVRGEKLDRPPVWAMRQAGRYLPEYRNTRAPSDFFTVCRTPELACEVTLQPIRRFPLDAAIIFSDILVVPQAVGMEVQMVPGKGPVFPEPLKTPGDMKKLCKPDVRKELKYVYDAITLTRHKLEGKVPLIGFAGGPWTLMAYMIEGGGSKTFSKAKTWLYKYPKESHELLSLLTDIIAQHLIEQIKAGAQLVQVFESWAGELSPENFNEFLLPYVKRISKYVRTECPSTPQIVFAKGAHFALEALSHHETGYNVVGLDWTMDPENAIERTGGRVALQGNLDPCVLFGSHESIASAARNMVAKFMKNPAGYVCNLGHGMMPDHDPEALGAFINAVVNYQDEE